jgi:amino acid permease
MRSSGYIHSLLNVFKGYIGISFLAIPHGFKQVGIYGAVIGLFCILLLNLYTVWLLIKARNKFKRTRIMSLSDLAEAILGETGRLLSDILLISTELTFCISYTIYFGHELDVLFCQTL